MRQLLGKKRGMTRLFKESGDCEAVTVIELGPCSVVQVKSSEQDGYDAMQIGFGDIRPKLVNKALKGHFKSSEPRRHLREIRLSGPAEHSVGDILTVDIFKPGERIDVIGTSKGLGHGVDFLCWPGGGGNAGVLELAREAGYLATTTHYEVMEKRNIPGQDTSEIGRTGSGSPWSGGMPMASRSFCRSEPKCSRSTHTWRW